MPLILAAPPLVPTSPTQPSGDAAGLVAAVVALLDDVDDLVPRAEALVRLLVQTCGAAGGVCWLAADGERNAIRVGGWGDDPATGPRRWQLPLTHAGATLGRIELARVDPQGFPPQTTTALARIGRLVGRLAAHDRDRRRLRELEKRYADTIEVAAVGIAHVTADKRIVHVNRCLCDMLGYTREALMQLTMVDISHPDDIAVTDDVRARLHGGEIPSFQIEKRYLRRDGTPVWMQLTISVQRDVQGQPVHDIAILQDISARRRAEAALQANEQRFRSLVVMSSDWYWETDEQLRFIDVGGRGTGARLSRMLRGRRPWELAGADTSPHWQELRARTERREPLRDFEYGYLDPRGHPRHVSVNGEPMHDAEGRFTGYRGASRDITPRKAYEARVQHLATHDSLTGLPNRAMFGELLGHVLARCAPSSRRFAVLFIDLDRFKWINDTLGHDAGDTLLCTLAQRLQDSLRSSDFTARLGGDEFVMLLQDLGGAEQAGQIASKLLSVLTAPVTLQGQDYSVTASIGISMYPDDARVESELMTHADIAMYHAKSRGRNNVQFYAAPMQHRSREQLTMESRLRQAIAHDTLTLHYQPKLALATGRIVGVEALLRWTDEELGPIEPGRFIPLAEETGLILPIGRRVLRMACAQAVAWQREGLPPVTMAVNLSPRQLAAPDLVADVRAALADAGLAPALLELEVTESDVMLDFEAVLPVLATLERMGVRLAIDDFGTGHSSLAQLKRFPFDTLKIDRAFVRDLPDDVEDCAIVDAVLSLGRTLGMTVVAEGVETQAQQDFLHARGCGQMQGFHFSRPLPADACADLLRRHTG